jgi:hypothetical protein
MRLPHSIRRLVALTLLPFLVASGLVSWGTLFRCRMSGLVASASCCADEHGRAAQEQDIIGRQPCCDVVGRGDAQAPSATVEPVNELAPPQSVSLPPLAVVLAERPVRQTTREAPIDTGPPVRLKNHSLHI